MDIRGYVDPCQYNHGVAPRSNKGPIQGDTPWPPGQNQPTCQPQEPHIGGRWIHKLIPHIRLTNDTGGVVSDESMVQGTQKNIPATIKGCHSEDYYENG